MTPEERAALEQRLKARRARLGGQPSDPMAPRVPQLEDPIPKLRAAEADLEKTAAGRFNMAAEGTGFTRDAEGVELARARSGQPEPVPEKPTLTESAWRAFLPHMTGPDNRPMSVAERGQYAAQTTNPVSIAKDIASAPFELVDAMASSRTAQGLARKAGLVPDIPYEATAAAERAERLRPPDEHGITTENQALHALRVFGTAVPAAITETAERAWSPDYARLIAGIRSGSLEDVAKSITKGSTVGETLSLDPGKTQKIHRDNPVADWMQGILERIEEGRSTEGDVEAQFRDVLGPDYANEGWWLGLGLDLATPWEGLALAPARTAGRVAETGRALKELQPKTVPTERNPFADAFHNHETESGEHLGERFAREIEAGRASVDDAPPKLRAFMDQVALEKYSMTPAELQIEEGIGRRPGLGRDVEFEQRVYAAQDARAALARTRAAQAQPPATAAPIPTPTPPATTTATPAPTPTPAPPPAAAAPPPAATATPPGPPARMTVGEFADRFDDAFAQLRTQRPLNLVELSDLRAAFPGMSVEDFNRYLLELRKRQLFVLHTFDGGHGKLTPEQAAGAIEEGGRRFVYVAERDDGGAARRVAARPPPPPPPPPPAAPPPPATPAPSPPPAKPKAKAKAKAKAPPEDPFDPDIDIDAGIPGVTPDVFAPREGRKVSPEAMAAAKERARLPAFGELFPATTDETRFWRNVERVYRGEVGQVDPKGYNIPRHEGFRRMVDAGTQSVDDVAYELRTATGGTIGAPGTFREITERALTRRVDGDVVWRGVQRPVARWSKSFRKGNPPVSWRTDYHMASPEEYAVAREIGKKDPRAIPARLSQIKKTIADQQKSARDIIGEAIANAATNAPATSTRPATSRLADVIRDAARLAVRDVMGTERLSYRTPTGAALATHEVPEMIRRVDEALGMTAAEAQKVIGAGGKTIPPATEAALNQFLPQRAKDTPLTPKDWVLARRSAARQVIGAIANERYHVQGLRPLAVRLMDAFKTFHLDVKPRSAFAKKWLERGPLAWFAKALTQDVLAKLPPQIRSVLKELQVGVERNTDDFMDEIRSMRSSGGSVERVLQQSIAQMHAINPDLLDAASAIRLSPLSSRTWRGQLAQLRKEWRGTRPEWLDSTDDIVASYGLKRWANDTRRQAADVGRQWLTSNLVASQKAVAGTTIAEQVADMTDEVGEKLYRELAAGELKGKALMAELDRQGVVDTPDPNEALIHLALTSRAESRITAAVQKLIGAGFLVRSTDSRLPALTSVLLGKHRRWNKDLQRWDYAHTEAQTAWAVNQLRNWGIEPGAATSIVPSKIGGVEVQLPAFLAEELESLRKSGVASSRDLTPNRLYNDVLKFYKEGLLHGIGVPNLAFFTGQMLGVLPTLITTRGLGDTVSSLGSMLYKRPVLTGELVRRLGGIGLPTYRPRTPEAAILRTDAGELIHIDELEQEARRINLGESRAGFETAAQIGTMLNRDGGGWFSKIKGLPRWWQEQLRRFASAIDVNVRVATFLDEVARGTPMNEAAFKAREAIYDYRDLTRWEAKYLRNIFTFYAFMRKSSDAFFKSMLTNPERALTQARIADASLRHGGLTGVELGGMSDDDASRWAVGVDRTVTSEEGRPHPLYKENRITSTPMGIAEMPAILRSFVLGAYIDGNGKIQTDPKMTLQQLVPLFQTLAILTQGRRLEKEYDTPYANRVPPVLLELGGDWMRAMFGIGPQKLEPEEDRLIADEDATEALGSNEPAVWAAGADKSLSARDAAARRALWQLFSVWLSRPISNLQQMAEASPFESIEGVRTPPNVTQSEATWDYLLGVKRRPVLDEREVIRRAQLRRAGSIGEEADRLRLPRDAGPVPR